MPIVELRRRAARLVLALVAVLASSALAVAGVQQTVEVEGVLCSGSYEGPRLLNHGYFAVTVELWNPTDHDVVVAFQAEQEWGGQDIVRKRVQLAAGERYSFEPLLRARVGSRNVYELSFRVDGESGEIALGPEEWPSGGEFCVMFYSSNMISAGSAERWSEVWTRRAGLGVIQVGGAKFSALSEQWMAYSSFETVVVSTDDGLPAPAQLDALLAWCRAGGRLVLCGASPASELADRPQDLKWLRPAHAVPTHLLWGDDPTFYFGMGTLTLVSSDEWAGQVMEEGSTEPPRVLGAATSSYYRPWCPGGLNESTTRMQYVEGLLGGFGDLPLRGLVLLLVVFALLMGPVNFMWVKKTRRPTLLLLTVPGISLVTSVLLIVFGILWQGLDVKVVTHSYTVLDQIDHIATTAEVRRIFAGASPGEGLRPESGTGIFTQSRAWRRMGNTGGIFTQDLDDGRLLGGEFLPVRKPATQLILSDHTSRLRLDVTSDGDRTDVANALGAPIERLLLRDVEGRYHHLVGQLDAGSSRELTHGASLQQRKDWGPTLELFRKRNAGRKFTIPPGSYLARVDAPDLRDSCGVDVTQISGDHYVFGFFAAPKGEDR